MLVRYPPALESLARSSVNWAWGRRRGCEGFCGP